MLRITDEMRAAVLNDPRMTVRILDQESNSAFVLMPEAMFERLCALMDDDALDMGSMYPHMTKLLAAGGLDELSDDFS